MVPQERLELPYSNYIVNDRLEGGDDTGARLIKGTSAGE